MRYFLSLLLLMSLLCSAVHSDDGVFLGYVSGNDYMKLDENSKESWLIGVMDGIIAEDFLANATASLSNKKENIDPWLGRCTSGRPLSQIKAMFEKELQDHPDKWHAPAALIFRDKFEKYCKKKR